MKKKVGNRIKNKKININEIKKNPLFYINTNKVKLNSGIKVIINEISIMKISLTCSELLNTNKNAYTLYNHILFPKKYTDVHYLNFITTLSDVPNKIERLIEWNMGIICNFSREINFYLEQKMELEKNIILGNYNIAVNILNSIEEKIGKSAWGLENRFLIEESMNGTRANKELLKSISNEKENTWILFLADIFSHKAESSVNPNQFSSRSNRMLSKIKGDELKDYFKYRVYGIITLDSNNIYNILHYSENSSLIDIYNAVRDSVLSLISKKESIPASYNLKSLVNRLLESFNDYSLYNAMAFLGTPIDNNSDLEKILLDIGNDYTLGKYEFAYDNSLCQLNRFPTCFELYEYNIKSAIRLSICPNNQENKSIKDKILKLIFDEYEKKENFQESHNELLTISRQIGTFDLSSQLLRFVLRRTAQRDSQSTYFTTVELLSESPNLRLAIYSDHKEVIISKYMTKYPDNSCCNLFALYYDCNNPNNSIISNIPQDRTLWYNAKKEYNNGDLKKALALLTEYSEFISRKVDLNNYDKERMNIAFYNILFELKDYLKCLDLFITNYLKNKNSVLKINFEQLYKVINDDNSSEYMKSIDLPILSSILNNEDYSSIFADYANFMDCNILSNPIDILNLKQVIIPIEKSIYFLRNICVTDILDSMFEILTTEEDVENLRIAICQKLIEIDIDNKKLYVNEISHITQQQELVKSINYLDQSKIDINPDKIRSSNNDISKENFIRFKELSKLINSLEIIDVNGAKLWLLSSISKDSSASSVKTRIYNVLKKTNYVFTMFKEMFYDYRHHFLFGTHGLDTSLGTRIRHGRLQNQIRNVFEENDLIFLKVSQDSQEFIASDSFNNLCSDNNLSIVERENLKKVLINFTEQIDEIVMLVKEKWIRIKIEEDSDEGIFDFIFEDEQLKPIFNQALEWNNDEVMYNCFEEILMNRLNIGLTNMKEKIRVDLKEKYIGCLNNLEISLNEHLTNINVIDNLKSKIILSRTAIQNELIEIERWFSLPVKQTYNDFTVEQLFITCYAVGKKIISKYDDIDIKLDNKSELKMKGEYFTYLVEIITILLTNSVYQSGHMTNLKNLTISIEVHENTDFIEIIWSNNLNATLNLKEQKNKLTEVKVKLYESKDKKSYFDYDKGSGFIRIAKMLLNNIEDKNYYLDFDINEEETMFWNKIRISKSIINASEVIQ